MFHVCLCNNNPLIYICVILLIVFFIIVTLFNSVVMDIE